MGQRTIRVALADDHTMFRQGMAQMLSTDPGIEVVAEAADGVQALEVVRSFHPDLLVLDVEMPRLGAHETLQKLGESPHRPKALIVSMFEDSGLVRELTDLGASGYLVKSASLNELISAVYCVMEADERNVTVSLPRDSFTGERRNYGGLSSREMEVLLLAARGLSNRQAALKLRLSEATIKRHLANIYNKLGVASRSEAASLALSEGWISSRELSRQSSR